MPGTQELTRRIKSIKSTRKITRAMQMVSAAKMRKAQSATHASRSYAEAAGDLIRTMGGFGEQATNPLLRQFPNAKKIGIVLISSNRGLIGSFNTNLINQVRRVEKSEGELLFELIVLGKKGREALVRLREPISAEFPKKDSQPQVEEIYPLAKMIADNYATGQYQKILLVYNYFVSTLIQKATVTQLLPFSKNEDDQETNQTDYIFEPSPSDVLDHLLPRIIESQLYQAILESDASEHSARMIMMKNATDAAGDLIDDLTLTFNQLRQNKITTELSEITAGRISLEK